MTIKYGKSINNNVAIRQRYEKALDSIVTKMRKDTEKELKSIFRSSSAKRYFNLAQDDKKNQSISTRSKLAIAALLLKFKLMFNGSARKLALRLAADTERYAATSVRSSLQELLGETRNTSIVSKVGLTRTQAIINENVSIIKSLPQQYFTQITNSVMEAIVTGQNAGLEAAIQKHGNVTERRAKAIAADQTHKATQAIAMQKMLDQGIKRFQWVYTYRSKEPRVYHIARDKKIYRFDKPPGGELPGGPPNCKCVIKPVAELE